MLSDEPDRPLHEAGHHHHVANNLTEEAKFDNAEDFDKGYLTKKYPSLALPNNVKNKEEIDILDDLEAESSPPVKGGAKDKEDRKVDRH
jgi:hypothetical protein